MVNFDVRRILVDEGSSCDIMYSHLFKTLQLDDSHLTPYVGADLQGFNDSTSKPWGYVEILVTLGEEETARVIKTQFVVDCESLYNCILGRPAIVELTAVPSTAHLMMKYYTKRGRVVTIKGDIEAARICFDAAVKGYQSVNKQPKISSKNKKGEQSNKPDVHSVDLDARFSEEELKHASEDPEATKGKSAHPVLPIPDGDFELIPLGDEPNKKVKIRAGIPEIAKKQLQACLRQNADLFAWSAAEMPGLDPEVSCHHLSINPATRAVAQRRRRQSPEKAEAAEKVVKDLLELVDNSAGYKLLSFMDAYSGYNQIPMARSNRKHTAFMTESGNYYYNVIPFRLKNAEATYQQMMNTVFRGEIRDTLEVYMDDMIVKSREEITHTDDLERVFARARQCRIRFNPEKCTFGARAGKFIGFYLTERGIKANPDKCRAFSNIPTPNNKKSIQVLNGMLTALSRFVAKAPQHALPFFKLLRKEETFSHLKQVLSHPPVLIQPDVGESLYLYLAVSAEAVSAPLIRETSGGQKPVYFTSKALQGPKVRYQQIKKVALSLIIAARRLRYYFLAHTIVVRTDHPIKQLLGCPDMAGRMLNWSFEMSEFDIQYESRKALKAQALADFIAEMTIPGPQTSANDEWTIFVDGASNSSGSGAGIILENNEGILIEVSLILSFQTSNNQAEYEALLAGIRLAEDLGARIITIYTDSQLVAPQVIGDYQAKNELLIRYLAMVKEKIKNFAQAKVEHVPREHNTRADILSKLASTRKKESNKSVIQETLPRPSVQAAAHPPTIHTIGEAHCWMTPVYNFLTKNELPSNQKEVAIVK
ncbi:uncharacterized protein LOC131659137 [Vicia villosa]|uniref:uncharacterized protein LOC131659137 n=1 Tax=Vicia villosa TaxID=3911 RepID=UPI00273CB8CF|nr:uncharacterized protein LOC131659137 [Vicia villosa]